MRKRHLLRKPAERMKVIDLWVFVTLPIATFVCLFQVGLMMCLLSREHIRFVSPFRLPLSWATWTKLKTYRSPKAEQMRYDWFGSRFRLTLSPMVLVFRLPHYKPHKPMTFWGLSSFVAKRRSTCPCHRPGESHPSFGIIVLWFVYAFLAAPRYMRYMTCIWLLAWVICIL